MAGNLAEPAWPLAWKTLPSGTRSLPQDRTINLNLQRFMANRIGATTMEVRSSHASPVSHPTRSPG
jgi:hypothetical protein